MTARGADARIGAVNFLRIPSASVSVDGGRRRDQCRGLSCEVRDQARATAILVGANSARNYFDRADRHSIYRAPWRHYALQLWFPMRGAICPSPFREPRALDVAKDRCAPPTAPPSTASHDGDRPSIRGMIYPPSLRQPGDRALRQGAVKRQRTLQLSNTRRPEIAHFQTPALAVGSMSSTPSTIYPSASPGICWDCPNGAPMSQARPNDGATLSVAVLAVIAVVAQ
jgi:hypothetical protein